MTSPSPPLTGTYRLQLRPEFGFDAAAAIVPYLAELGISHVYSSPILEATPGSQHGYDVVDPAKVRDELGGDEGLARLVAALDEHHLGLIIDIVPHHMAATATANVWWWDVLRFGETSRYGRHFDIDWNPPEAKLRGSILLPVLGDQYGKILDQGELSVERSGGAFHVRYYDLTLPLSPIATGAILQEAADATGHAELGFVARSLASIEAGDRTEEQVVADTNHAEGIVADLCARDADVDRAINHQVELLNRDVDRLDAMLEDQSYRLARWKVGDYELDYRRFFDIDSLVAVRVEDQQVFDDTHRLIAAWLERGVVDGVRVDHVDGLREPAQYLDRLREAAGVGRYVVVEKILAADEELRTEWPVDGTTGYEFADLVTGLLVDPNGQKPFLDAYQAFTGDDRHYHDVAIAKRQLILDTSLAADVERLTGILAWVCERQRRYRDFTRVELREGLRAVAIHAPSYRSYVSAADPEGPPVVTTGDIAFVDLAVARARDANPQLDADLFDLLQAVLTLRFDGRAERELALRFQQLTGPVAAKGEEDSATYSWLAFVARNEVGGNPERFSISPADFHEANRRRLTLWPQSMLTTSTHDTKRSEDVRARLAALSELPDLWEQAVQRWSAINARYRQGERPDRRTEWLLYQTLAGAHPISAERAGPYMLKAIREAKEHTSWTANDEAYEAAVTDFTTAVADDATFLTDLDATIAPFVEAGWVNSIAQATLRLLSPGVPDTYQGTELWDLSLVDPDNRREVDYDDRQRHLREIRRLSAADAWSSPVHRAAGTPKLVAVHRSLQLRRDRPELFEMGDYAALEVDGLGAEHAVGFVRADEVAVVVPRLPIGIGANAGEVRIALPAGRWRDVITGADVRSSGTVSLAETTPVFPVAVLTRSGRS